MFILTKCVFISLHLLIITILCGFFPSATGYEIVDPIRNSLEFWGRLLYRMSQNHYPSDDELHFQINYDDLPNLSNLLMHFGFPTSKRTKMVPYQISTTRASDSIPSSKLITTELPLTSDGIIHTAETVVANVAAHPELMNQHGNQTRRKRKRKKATDVKHLSNPITETTTNSNGENIEIIHQVYSAMHTTVYTTLSQSESSSKGSMTESEADNFSNSKGINHEHPKKFSNIHEKFSETDLVTKEIKIDEIPQMKFRKQDDVLKDEISIHLSNVTESMSNYDIKEVDTTKTEAIKTFRPSELPSTSPTTSTSSTVADKIIGSPDAEISLENQTHLTHSSTVSSVQDDDKKYDVFDENVEGFEDIDSAHEFHAPDTSTIADSAGFIDKTSTNIISTNSLTDLMNDNELDLSIPEAEDIVTQIPKRHVSKQLKRSTTIKPVIETTNAVTSFTSELVINGSTFSFLTPGRTVGRQMDRNKETLDIAELSSSKNLMKPVNSIIDGIGPLILPMLGYDHNAAINYYPHLQKTGIYGTTNYASYANDKSYQHNGRINAYLNAEKNWKNTAQTDQFRNTHTIQYGAPIIEDANQNQHLSTIENMRPNHRMFSKETGMNGILQRLDMTRNSPKTQQEMPQYGKVSKFQEPDISLEAIEELASRIAAVIPNYRHENLDNQLSTKSSASSHTINAEDAKKLLQHIPNTRKTDENFSYNGVFGSSSGINSENYKQDKLMQKTRLTLDENPDTNMESWTRHKYDSNVNYGMLNSLGRAKGGTISDMNYQTQNFNSHSGGVMHGSQSAITGNTGLDSAYSGANLGPDIPYADAQSGTYGVGRRPEKTFEELFGARRLKRFPNNYLK